MKFLLIGVSLFILYWIIIFIIALINVLTKNKDPSTERLGLNEKIVLIKRNSKGEKIKWSS